MEKCVISLNSSHLGYTKCTKLFFKDEKVMKALGLCVLLFSTSAWSNVTDVEFIPAEGNLYLKSTFRMDSESRKETSQAGIKIEERDQDAMIFENSLTYGLFKNLELGMEWDITIKDETSITSQKYNGADQTAGTTTYNYFEDPINNPGLQDPFFKARYRMPLPGGYGFNFDVYGAFSPSIGDAERGTSDITTLTKNNLDGNAYWGGHRARVGAGINQDIDQFQWSFNFTAQMNLEREIKQFYGNQNPVYHNLITVDAYNDFTFSAKVLYEMIDQVHLLGTLSFVFNGEQDWNNQTNTIRRDTLESHSDIHIGLHAYWNFTEMLSVRVGFEFANLGDYENQYYQSNVLQPASSTRISDLSKTSLLAGLDFSF
jgi:hypothetical protein